MGGEPWFAGMWREGSPGSFWSSLLLSAPSHHHQGPASPIPSPPLFSSQANPPSPLLPLHPTFSSLTPGVGLAEPRILWFGVGGGDLLPPGSRTPSSHVLGRSARPSGRVITVAAAAEPPARAVSIPGTGQGARKGRQVKLRVGSVGPGQSWYYPLCSLHGVPCPRFLDLTVARSRVGTLRLGTGRDALPGSH